METLIQKFLPINPIERNRFFKKLKSYVYVYCEIDEDNRRIPIYIGKGKSTRVLSHLNNLDELNDQKNKKISNLIANDRLGIDILAYGLDDKTALHIESACIDLMGIDNLVNKVRGHGDNIKRLSLIELSNVIQDQKISVLQEHKGVAILINKDFKPTFSDLQTFEITRGIWSKSCVTTAKDAKYAYAIFNGVVKDVYEIYGWVPAGTQQYFTRELTEERLLKNPWEFIGKKAPEEVRQRYIHKVIERPRSFGSPFIKVG